MILASAFLQRLHLLHDDLELRVGEQCHFGRCRLDGLRHVHERDGRTEPADGIGRGMVRPVKIVAAGTSLRYRSRR